MGARLEVVPPFFLPILNLERPTPHVNALLAHLHQGNLTVLLAILRYLYEAVGDATPIREDGLMVTAKLPVGDYIHHVVLQLYHVCSSSRSSRIAPCSPSLWKASISSTSA